MKISNKAFNEKYRIIKLIDEGGMGEVFKVINKLDKQFYTAKFIKKSKINSKNIEKFKKEIIALTRVLGPKFMQIYEYFLEKDFQCVIYKYIEGTNLAKIITDRNFIPINEATSYMKQILKAFEIMTANGLYHRDIKPHNILIRPNGDVVICDFGLAISREETTLKHSKSIEGTIYYFSPEVISGYDYLVESEIFSTGILFFQMLFGRVPFWSDNKNKTSRNDEIKYKIRNQALPNMKLFENKVPQALENVLIKATAKLPSQRHHSFKEFYDDLVTSLGPSRLKEPKIKVNSKYYFENFDLKIYNNNMKKSKFFNLPKGYWFIIGFFLLLILGIYFYVR